jgi:hypothetical protein
MKRSFSTAAVILCMVAAAACSKRRVHYECQCYQKGYYTHSYNLGVVPGEQVYNMCHSIQQQYAEDTCYGSGSLK